MPNLRCFLDKCSRRLHLGHVFSRPISLSVEHTTRCNLKCRTCARSYWGGQFRDMDPLVVERVKNEIIPLVEHVGLSGYGEPLLGQHFEGLFNCAREQKKEIGIITNGVLLDDTLMQRLFDANCTVHLSIDGSTNETMRYLRGIDFDPILAKVKRFHALKQQNPHNDFQLVILYVVLRRNIQEIPRLIEILAEYSVDKLMIQAPTFGQRNDEMIQESLIHEKDLARRMFPIIRDTARQRGLEVLLPNYHWLHEPISDAMPSKPSVKEPAKRQGKAPQAFLKCYLPWFEVYVDVDGNVKACCFGTAAFLGSLKTQSFSAIWNGEPFQHLRKTVNSQTPPDYCRCCGLTMGRNAGDENQAILPQEDFHNSQQSQHDNEGN